MPRRLVDAAVAAKSLINAGHPWLDQAVMAEFIHSGGFERHLRLIRIRYLARRDHLIGQLQRWFTNRCIVKGTDGGMHVTVRLTGMAMNAHELQSRLKLVGAGIYSLSESPARQFRRFADDDEIILLGYAGISEHKITIAVLRMAQILQG